MDFIKGKIGQFGLFLAGLGAISIILSFFNYNVRLLAWIDIWGATAGWIIRILLIVVGLGLFLMMGGSQEEE